MDTGMILLVTGCVFLLAAVVLHIIILVHAFKQDIPQGFLSLFVPFYIIFFAFARMDHARKWTLIIIWLVAILAGLGLLTAGFETWLTSDESAEAAHSEIESTDIEEMKNNIPSFPELPPLQKKEE